MTNDNEALIPAAHPGAFALMPVMNVESALRRYEVFHEFVNRCLAEGVDYGIIPGTTKKTLMKPGAEKLNTLFGLCVRLICVDAVEDWTGKDHDGEPFFSYRYACEVYAGNTMIVSSEGSCNSWEVKYRYRNAERVCPICGKAAIIRGKAEYGGGWLCFSKKGGCGAKFPDDSQEIEGQAVGKVANPDVCDQVNTFQKMAQKRAYVGSSILATNASEYFTQDLDDFTSPESESERVAQAKPVNGKTRAAAPQSTVSAEESRINDALLAECIRLKGERNGPAFFDAKYGKLSPAEREAKARELGLIAAPAIEVAEAAVVESEPVEATPVEMSPRDMLLAEINEMREGCPDALKKQFASEFSRQLTNLEAVDYKQLNETALRELVEGLRLWFQSKRK